VKESKKSKEEEYLNGWKRAQADLANYKKDELKRFEEFARFANEGLVRSLLPVLDSFELAASSSDPSSDKGFYLIKTQLETTLKEAGLEPIRPSSGDQFDLAIHEAIAGNESDTVAELITTGYSLNGKIIRPARVKL